ncbi:MAG: RNA polymerase sigma factor [Ktedonobacterales bacterium]
MITESGSRALPAPAVLRLLAVVLAPQGWHNGWRRGWRARFALAPFDQLHPSHPSQPARPSASGVHRQQFEALFARYQQPLLDYLYGMTRDREWAADLVQETFLRAYAAAPDLAAITYPQAWLYRIATNLALSALRRRKRFSWLTLNALEPGDAGSSDRHRLPPQAQIPHEDMAATVVERDAVWQVLAELPPRWRSVLLLHTTSGFAVSEVAESLNLSEANVRKILFRAKERFRVLHAQLAQQSEQDVTGGRR